MWPNQPLKTKKVAGVVLFHHETARILVLQKNDLKWDLPKGHVEPNEQESVSAYRECLEETGLAIDLRESVCITYPSKSMIYFYLGVYYGDQDDVSLSHEHMHYAWVPPSKAIKLFGSRSHFSKIIRAMCILL